MDGKEKRHATFYLSEGVLARLEDLSNRTRRRKNSIVEAALEKYFEIEDYKLSLKNTKNVDEILDQLEVDAKDGIEKLNFILSEVRSIRKGGDAKESKEDKQTE